MSTKTMSVRQLRDRKAELVEEAEAIHKKVVSEKRNMTKEERKKWDDSMEEVEDLNKELATAERQAEIDMAEAAEHGTSLHGDGTSSRAYNPEKWVTKEGKELRAYLPNEKISKASEKSEVAFGDVARALLSGPRTPAEKRVLSEGVNADGGFLVPTNLSRTVIDMFRAKMRTIQAGMKTIPLPGNNLKMAKLISDPVVAWRNEGADVVEASAAFGKVEWVPRSIAAYVPVTRELMQDADNMGSLLSNALTQAVAQELDRVALFGSGVAPQPKGIVNYTGTQKISMGTNGAAITNYSQLIRAYQLAMEGNGDEPTAAIFSPRSWAAYAGLTATDGQPLMMPKAIEKLPLLVTTKMPNNQTKGTANNASSIVIGHFPSLYMGVREDITIEVSNIPLLLKLQTVIVVHARVDFAAIKENDFVVIEGVIPAA